MTKHTPTNTLWQIIIKYLSHPAWNGLSCFFTALGTFGIGTLIVAYSLGLLRQVQDLLNWLINPIELPIGLVVVGAIIILAFISTAIYGSISAKRKQRRPENNHRDAYVTSELDIELMRQLADAKEEGSYWIDITSIMRRHKLTKNQSEYYLRILEKHGYVHQQWYEGSWGIKEKGIDYLIENKHI